MTEKNDKDTCPICFELVTNDTAHNCLQCMICDQKIHAKCEMKWNQERKPTNRFLRDDILICPVCTTDSIAYCGDLLIDINADLKKAVRNNPNMKGGKIYKKSKKNKKNKKSRNHKTKKQKNKRHKKTKRNKT